MKKAIWTQKFQSTVSQAVFWTWIQIGSDPHHLAGSGLVSIPSICIFYFFHEYFNMWSKILKFMTHLPLMSKEKLCKLAFLWIKVKKCCLFSNMCETGVGMWIGIVLMPIRIQIWIDNKMKSQIQSQIGKTISIHNTANRTHINWILDILNYLLTRAGLW